MVRWVVGLILHGGPIELFITNDYKQPSKAVGSVTALSRLYNQIEIDNNFVCFHVKLCH